MAFLTFHFGYMARQNTMEGIKVEQRSLPHKYWQIDRPRDLTFPSQTLKTSVSTTSQVNKKLGNKHAFPTGILRSIFKIQIIWIASCTGLVTEKEEIL